MILSCPTICSAASRFSRSDWSLRRRQSCVSISGRVECTPQSKITSDDTVPFVSNPWASDVRRLLIPAPQFLHVSLIVRFLSGFSRTSCRPASRVRRTHRGTACARARRERTGRDGSSCNWSRLGAGVPGSFRKFLFLLVAELSVAPGDLFGARRRVQSLPLRFRKRQRLRFLQPATERGAEEAGEVGHGFTRWLRQIAPRSRLVRFLVPRSQS